MISPAIPNWHKPRNEACAQNSDPAANCTCKRVVNRKPFRVVKVNDKSVAYGLRPKIVVEVHPNGVLVFRELGRRKKYETTAGKVFSGIVWKEAMKLAAERKAKRRGKRL